MENGSTSGFVVAAALRDRLRELTFVAVYRHVELTVVAVHNHAILILKRDICKVFISGRPSSNNALKNKTLFNDA